MTTIPYVIEQTSRGERSYDFFSRLLSDRIVFSGEEVSDVSASLIIAQMLFLATDIKITSDHIQKSKKRLNTILSENTGKSIDEVLIFLVSFAGENKYLIKEPDIQLQSQQTCEKLQFVGSLYVKN